MTHSMLKKFGALTLLILTVHFAKGQEDPYVKTDSTDAQPAATMPKPINCTLILESFSLPLEDASKLLREIPNDKERYQYLLQQTETKKVKLEHFQLLRSKNGNRVVIEHIKELRYATEYGSTKEPPKAFEVRNTGETVEVEPNVGPDMKTIDLTLQPQIVTFLGDRIFDTSGMVKQPLFCTRKITTQVSATDGVPFLLGTFNPPRFADVEEKTPSAIWLLFVTVRIEAPQ